MKKEEDRVQKWVDYYQDKMSAEEKQWLKDFNKKHPEELDGVSFEYTQEKKDD